MKCVLGIDPGLGGALALVSPDGVQQVWDMPVLALSRNGKAKNRIDHTELARIMDSLTLAGEVVHAFIEEVGAMPGQGVSSTFAFGFNTGSVVQAVACQFFPYTTVTPRKWQAGIGLPVGGGKDACLGAMKRLYPTAVDQEGRPAFRLVRHNGRADACGIALYGLNVLRKEGRL